MLDKALAKGLITRALSRSAQVSGPITIPGDLTDRIVAGLTQRLVNLVGFARRASEAVCGFETVRSWVRDGKAAVLLSAGDGSVDGKRKIVGMARAMAEDEATDPPPVVECLTATQLGNAFGRDHVVHAAVAAGGLADRISLTAAKLAGLSAPVPVATFSPGQAPQGAEPASLSRDDR